MFQFLRPFCFGQINYVLAREADNDVRQRQCSAMWSCDFQHELAAAERVGSERKRLELDAASDVKGHLDLVLDQSQRLGTRPWQACRYLLALSLLILILSMSVAQRRKGYVVWLAITQTASRAISRRSCLVSFRCCSLSIERTVVDS